MNEYKKLAQRAVDMALSSGAETAEVHLRETVDFDVLVRKDMIENLNESTSRSISITLSVDKRKAIVSSSDLKEESISKLIKEGIELCRIMDRDEYFSLPDQDELGSVDKDLAIFDTETLKVETERKIEIAREVESAALKLDARIISDGGFFSNTIQKIVLANSAGFCDGYQRTFNSFGVSCAIDEIRKEGENIGKKQASYWYSTSVFFSALEPIEKIAQTAVERTIRKLGAVKPETQKVPIVMDNTTASEFLGYLASALNGGNIYRKASFLVNKLNEKIASDMVTIVDDPLLQSKLGSRPFDGEGVRSRKNVLVEGGVLKSYLLSTYQARKLGLKTTGNAGGRSNLYIEPGPHSPEKIIESVDNGLYLTFMSGPGANIVTGDFSKGAQGIWIRNGKLDHPVDEFTVASTFQDMLNGISMIGNDLDWRRAVSAPTIKIENITISGI